MRNTAIITPPISNGKFLSFDVADQDTNRFICTMKMPVTPLFKVSLEEIMSFVYTKRPTLKYRRIIIELL